MKVFLFIICSLFSVSTLAQSDLHGFIKKIARDLKIDVAIDPSLLNYNMSINQNPTSVDEVYALLAKIGLDYYVINDNYILLRKANVPTVKTKTIKGRIFDNKSGQPIAYASVYLTDMSNGTSTDEEGRFSIKVSEEGNHQMEVSFLGYENQKIENTGRPINISLVEKQTEIKQVTIIAAPIQKIDFTSANFMPDYSSYKLMRINSTDLARTIQLSIPGVSRTDNAQILIRNMRQDKTLSVVNNIPVLKTGHYYNTISNFNELYFNEIDVYKNVFPSQYGNALGGLVKYTSSINESKKIGLNTTSNLLYSGLAGFVKTKHFSFNLGARKSYINLNKHGILEKNLFQLKTNSVLGNGIVSNIPEASFNDMNFQMNYTYGKSGKISINGLGNFDEDRLQWENKNSFLIGGNQSVEITQNYFNRQKNKHRALSLSNETMLSEKILWSTDAHIYEYKDTFNLEANTQKVVDGRYSEFDDTYTQTQGVSTKGISTSIAYSINKAYNFVSGIFLKEVSLDFNGRENERKIADLKQSALQSSIFEEFNVLKADYTIKAGAKVTRFSTLDKIYFEPYICLSRKISTDVSLKSSYAYRVQNLNLMDFEARFSQNLNYYYLSNDTLPVQKGHHFMVGVRFQKNGFTFDVEAYKYNNTGNQLFTNIVTGFPKDKNQNPPPPPNVIGYKFFTGTNNIMGIDFMVNYKYNNWQSNINYTLSKSVQTFSGIYRNQEIPSPTDRRHAISINNSFSMGRLSLGTNLAFMSGSPYISYNLTRPEKGKNELARRDVIEYLPDYISVDVAANYTILTKPFKVNLGVSINNITNNSNVKFIQQTGSFEEKKNSMPIVTGNQSLMLGRFFNVHVKTSF